MDFKDYNMRHPTVTLLALYVSQIHMPSQVISVIVIHNSFISILEHSCPFSISVSMNGNKDRVVGKGGAGGGEGLGGGLSRGKRR